VRRDVKGISRYFLTYPVDKEADYAFFVDNSKKKEKNILKN
jgi:hypothetical protein